MPLSDDDRVALPGLLAEATPDWKCDDEGVLGKWPEDPYGVCLCTFDDATDADARLLGLAPDLARALLDAEAQLQAAAALAEAAQEAVHTSPPHPAHAALDAALAAFRAAEREEGA